MLRYLAGQASVSLENIELNELVSADAVTDALTALPDAPRLRELLEAEVARAERYGHDLSLLLVAVDDLGRGSRPASTPADAVLREAARIVDECSHGMERPGRWGSGELAVVVPETGVDGAFELAERIRGAIELAELPLTEHRGDESATASVGIGTLARFGGTADRLVQAAGAAARQGQSHGWKSDRGDGARGACSAKMNVRACRAGITLPSERSSKRRARGASLIIRGAAPIQERDAGRRG